MNWPFGPRSVASILGSALDAVPWSALGIRTRWTAASPESPQFAVRTEDGDLRFFTARGGHIRVTDALVGILRSLPEPLGVVLVESDTGCEWVGSSGLRRGQVLEAMMSLRDVLGRGPLDLAVFSEDGGTEVYLDRLGTLEVRAGSWKEGALCRFLENAGFRRMPRLSVLPPASDGENEADSLDLEVQPAAYEERLAEVCLGLGLTGGLTRPVPSKN